MGFTVSSAIAGIEVLWASWELNTKGDGTLKAVSTSSVSWAAPDGSAGSAVSIANGETKLLHDGDDASAVIAVKRTSASDLTGTATVTLTGLLTTLERLEAVQDAITKTESAQASTWNDRQIQRAQLATLYKREGQLMRLWHAEDGTGPRAIQPDFGNVS